MRKISVTLTLDQLQALHTLAENQLFRIKHIDPKIPGYIVDPGQLEVSASALQVLSETLKAVKQPKARTITAGHR